MKRDVAEFFDFIADKQERAIKIKTMTPEQVIELAAENGFVFTSDELKQSAEQSARLYRDGEASDENPGRGVGGGILSDFSNAVGVSVLKHVFNADLLKLTGDTGKP